MKVQEDAEMIFIVDDSKAIRERLAKMLSEIDGVKVIGEASNAAEAVTGIRTLKPKVVILDIQMPDGNGIEVLKIIKQEKPAPLVMMMTNHSSAYYREKCLKLGADYFLDKARDFEKLVEIFKDLIERYGPEAVSGSINP
ncbi:MAG TPA: response regulator transcription factor [Pyrinomonadaceae bacterium]|nr:response regulator transcription factor [Pyrinomonadaceae bacterium]